MKNHLYLRDTVYRIKQQQIIEIDMDNCIEFLKRNTHFVEPFLLVTENQKVLNAYNKLLHPLTKTN